MHFLLYFLWNLYENCPDFFHCVRFVLIVVSRSQFFVRISLHLRHYHSNTHLKSNTFYMFSFSLLGVFKSIHLLSIPLFHQGHGEGWNLLSFGHQSITGLTQRLPIIQTHIHTYGPHSIASWPNLHAFSLWEETWTLRGNSHRHRTALLAVRW